MASSRELKWEKEHLGPLYLTESVTSGYAYWNFEEEYNKPPKPPPEPPKKALTAAEAMENRRPPEKLQPFMSASSVSTPVDRDSQAKVCRMRKPPL